MSNKIFFFGQKNYKQPIGYLVHESKTQPLYITLPKTRAYVKNYSS